MLIPLIFVLHFLVIDPAFELKGENADFKRVVDKILNLPLEDRAWPNYLGRLVKNPSNIDPKDLQNKLNKSTLLLGGESSKGDVKSVPQRTRSKSVPSAAKNSSSIQSVSCGSLDSPKSERGLEVSSSRTYVKGIRRLLFLMTYFSAFMFLLVLLLTFVEPFYFIVEFKPPVLKSLIISSREMFIKRARDDRPAETESSKAPILFNMNLSPESKKIKPSPSASLVRHESSVLVFHGYNADVKQSDLAHMLEDLLLNQYVDATTNSILDDVAGHAFHVSHYLPCFYCQDVLLFKCAC